MAEIRHPRLWLAALILPVASLGCGCSPQAPEPPAGSVPEPSLEQSELQLPMVTTPVAGLGQPGFKHVEVLRIQRDFGKRDFEIAMDAWLPDGNLGRIETVRLWWYKTNKDGERGPFSSKTKRYFDIAYLRVDDGTWQVQMLADDRRFTFLVAADGRGGVFATGTAVLKDGSAVENCQMQHGDLRAAKVFGMPTGIEELRVTCTDSEGVVHEGELAS